VLDNNATHKQPKGLVACLLAIRAIGQASPSQNVRVVQGVRGVLRDLGRFRRGRWQPSRRRVPTVTGTVAAAPRSAM
jgi:hypothetical protein